MLASILKQQQVLVAGFDSRTCRVASSRSWCSVSMCRAVLCCAVLCCAVCCSGKTHTMMGTPSDAGVVPRAIQALFDRIKASEDRWGCLRLGALQVMQGWCREPFAH
jgi:hypothetical protein